MVRTLPAQGFSSPGLMRRLSILAGASRCRRGKEGWVDVGWAFMVACLGHTIPQMASVWPACTPSWTETLYHQER